MENGGEWCERTSAKKEKQILIIADNNRIYAYPDSRIIWNGKSF